MNEQARLDDALDAALGTAGGGAQLRGDFLHRRFGAELSSLLHTGSAIQAAAAHTIMPAPARLDENFAIVRAAVQRAAMAAPASAQAPKRASDAWWHRRLAIASMSVPLAAMLAVLAFGVVGAAAATVAVTAAVRGNDPLAAIRRIPQDVVEAVKPGPPATPIVDTPDMATVPPPTSREAHAATLRSGASSPFGVPGGAWSASTPQNDGAARSLTAASPAPVPTRTTVTGTITELHGNTFTLATEAGDFKVQVDAMTDITGVIAVAASATVSGELTAEKNVRADSVTVASDAAADSLATPTVLETSPAGQASTHTPGPPPGKGPQTAHTPPDVSDGYGNPNPH